MGMYNEVFVRCPKCSHNGYMQITQIVLGFGNFHLNNFETLRNLNEEELITLKERVLEDKFKCENKNCGNWFNPYTEKSEIKLKLIDSLFKY